MVGGRAWDPPVDPSPETARFLTPFARPTYTLGSLPPRFVRALRELLDPDERLLFAVERPGRPAAGIVDQLRGGSNRRAGLLVLTDRQLAWLVDHADPDRYLSDWGVDVELIPIERPTEVECRPIGQQVLVDVATPAGRSRIALPIELVSEVRLMVRLAARFLAVASGSSLRRIYVRAACEIDWVQVDAFRQSDLARALIDRLPERPLAVLFSPRRPGQREPAALAAGETGVTLITKSISHSVPYHEVHAIRLSLTPLAGRFTVVCQEANLTMTYPAPFGSAAARLARAIRAATANAAAA
jgi:hypothetical protein